MVWKAFVSGQIGDMNRGRKEVYGIDRLLSEEDMMALVNGKHPTAGTIFAFSEHIAKPSDVVDVKLSGYLYQPEMGGDHSWFGVSNEMASFFENGPAPVYIGWGSMCCGLEHTPRITKVAVGALKKANKRGIILKGWQKLSLESIQDDPELYEYAKKNVYFVDRAAHNWILPRCEAVMVHGEREQQLQQFEVGDPLL